MKPNKIETVTIKKTGIRF